MRERKPSLARAFCYPFPMRTLTGLRPTGQLHLGNWLGAVRPMVELAKTQETFLMVADVHALNEGMAPDVLRQNVIDIVRLYLACGIDPEKTILYRQSDLPNAEFATYLMPFMGVGQLERSHAFKDMLANGKEANAGLFTYPVLMAADILLYDTDHVPVGPDQAQHVEYARDIAERVNHRLGNVLKLPNSILQPDVSQLPGLDGRKMSKSYGNGISLSDDTAAIKGKVAKLVTDSRTPDEAKDPESVIALYMKLFVPEQYEAFLAGGMGYGTAKQLLAEAISKLLGDVHTRYQAVGEEQVHQVLAAGAAKARPVAEATLQRFKTAAGLA